MSEEQPHLVSDENTERRVVSSISQSRKIFGKVRDLLSSECFTNLTYREIFEASAALYDRDEPVDSSAVSFELQKRNSQITLKDLLLLDSGYNFYLESDVNKLVQLKNRRALFFASERMKDASTNVGVDYDTAIRVAEDAINQARANERVSRTMVEDFFSTILENIDSNQRGQTKGSPTGFAEIDKTGGLHKRDLIIVAGESRMGKTSLACCFALTTIKSGGKVCMYSMEMGGDQILTRLLSMESRIPSSDIMYGHLSQMQRDRLVQCFNNFPKERFFIDERSNSNVDTIIASIRRLKDEYDIDGAIVDYTQMLSINGAKGMNRVQQLAEIARAFKNLAKELDIWIICLSQLNRNREDPAPTLDRIRSSGEITEAADEIYFVYRPEEISNKEKFPSPFEGTDTKGKAWIKRAKGRNTGTMSFICNFIGPLTMFSPDDVQVAPSEPTEQAVPF